MAPTDKGLAAQPVGVQVSTIEVQRPTPIRIEGRFCRLEALDPAVHGDGLWRSLRDDDNLWTYFNDGPFSDARSFAAWLDTKAGLHDAVAFSVVDVTDGIASGIVNLMEIRPPMRSIEIGGIIYGPALQRTPAATEAQYLMARYVFEGLGYRRYEWKCDALNAASRRLALRLGFAFEGIFRQHRIVKGHNRDTAWYSMLDGEWPGRKTIFEKWLAADNFDESGRQRMSMSTMNAAAPVVAAVEGRL